MGTVPRRPTTMRTRSDSWLRGGMKSMTVTAPSAVSKVVSRISVSRKFASGLYLQGSYTYSRTEGNYPGSVSYDNGQIDPNISSQYDLVELLANHNGPLPQDRPHSLKIDAYRGFDVGGGTLTIGTRIRAISGVPSNAAKQAAESKRGQQSQSMEPVRDTSAAVSQSPMSA